MEREATLALGAFPVERGTRFGLWSTTTRSAAVRLFDERGAELRSEPLEAHGDGVFSITVPGVRAGALYKFVLDGDEIGDPYARFLPHGVFGPARVEAPGKPLGKPLARRGAPRTIYEIHIGTFTQEGTYSAAGRHLREIAELGVDAIEIMPVAAFPGQRGWGYDGVAHYAPFAPYGEPAELRKLIADAHELGLAVILDVVYNHFGPAGNWLPRYAPEYFTEKTQTPWGPALNFEHPRMRQYVLDNVRYWFDEFGFDGLRLDATHAITDPSPEHVLRSIRSLAASPGASKSAPRVLIAEDERNDPDVVLELGMDGVWADDFHHAVRVNLTRERDGYYGAYPPNLECLAETIAHGWLYDGRVNPMTGEARGRPATELEFSNLVYCIQNHDQIGNRALGTRLNHEVSLEAYCAASMLLLFLPATALLFMGQEWAASSPFLYFTDHDAELGELIRNGRREEFKHFGAFSDPKERSKIPDPQAESTFTRSVLNWDERQDSERRRVLDVYRQMLRLRREDPILSAPTRRYELECRADGDTLIAIRKRGEEQRALVMNWGAQELELPKLKDATVLMASAAPDPTRLQRYGAVLFADRLISERF